MIFSSLIFIWGFLPLSLTVYYLSPPKPTIRNAVLLILSIFFYAFGDMRFVIPVILLAFLNWISGLIIHRSRYKKKLLFLFTVLNLSVLIVYKYIPLFLPNSYFVSSYLSTLPLGISFFTFQNITYLCDVEKEAVSPEPSPSKYLLYITFFPQLIAGPIVKYRDIKPYIDYRKADVPGIISGIKRFSVGLFKKTVLAGSLSVIADELFSTNLSTLPALYAWLGAIGYSLQIYYDFSGYTDMATGLGQMFGFTLPENFNHPYLADSVSDFFRRWHMTLTGFFREYVYIPLGGNRNGAVMTVINTLIVFILTGLWHGGKLTYIVWGLYNGILIVFEKTLFNRLRFRSVSMSLLKHLITLALIVTGWVFFRSESLYSSISYIRAMYSFDFTIYYGTLFYRFINIKYAFVIIVSIFFAGPHILLFKKNSLT